MNSMFSLAQYSRGIRGSTGYFHVIHTLFPPYNPEHPVVLYPRFSVPLMVSPEMRALQKLNKMKSKVFLLCKYTVGSVGIRGLHIDSSTVIHGINGIYIPIQKEE